MARVTSNLTGLAPLRARVAGLAPTAVRCAGDGLRDVAEATADQIRQDLGAGSHPSVPGTAPSDIGGRIADAVEVETDPDGAVRLIVALPFARDLEFGTSRMAARPFLRPAAARVGQDAAALVARRVADALRKEPP